MGEMGKMREMGEIEATKKMITNNLWLMTNDYCLQTFINCEEM
jgi:hypothetical protein